MIRSIALALLAGCSAVTEADMDRLAGDPGGASCDENPGCDDEIECTNDFCNGESGQCEHEPLDDRCGGARCVPNVGCQDEQECEHVDDCDDGDGCFTVDCKSHVCERTPVDSDGDGSPRCGGDCNDGDGATNPGVPEICGDGLDNDCNGNADGQDPLCDDPCGADQTILDEGEVEGDVGGAGQSNSDDCERAIGPERLVRLVLREDANVTIETSGSGFDTVIYVRDGCDGAEIGCSDNRSQARAWLDSRLWLPELAAGTYYVVIDAADGGGHYHLRVRRSNPDPPTCDNPLDISGGGSVAGTTAGESRDDRAPCSDATGPEHVFTLRLEERVNVTIDSRDSGFDVVQDLRRDGCDGNSMPGWCADGTNGGETRSGALDEGRYAVIVDGWQGDSGRYVLRYFP